MAALLGEMKERPISVKYKTRVIPTLGCTKSQSSWEAWMMKRTPPNLPTWRDSRYHLVIPHRLPPLTQKALLFVPFFFLDTTCPHIVYRVYLHFQPLDRSDFHRDLKSHVPFPYHLSLLKAVNRKRPSLCPSKTSRPSVSLLPPVPVSILCILALRIDEYTNHLFVKTALGWRLFTIIWWLCIEAHFTRSP